MLKQYQIWCVACTEVSNMAFIMLWGNNSTSHHSQPTCRSFCSTGSGLALNWDVRHTVYDTHSIHRDDAGILFSHHRADLGHLPLLNSFDVQFCSVRTCKYMSWVHIMILSFMYYFSVIRQLLEYKPDCQTCFRQAKLASWHCWKIKLPLLVPTPTKMKVLCWTTSMRGCHIVWPTTIGSRITITSSQGLDCASQKDSLFTMFFTHLQYSQISNNAGGRVQAFLTMATISSYGSWHVGCWVVVQPFGDG